MDITGGGSVHLARMICILLLQFANHVFSIYSFAARFQPFRRGVRKKRAFITFIILYNRCLMLSSHG